MLDIFNAKIKPSKLENKFHKNMLEKDYFFSKKTVGVTKHYPAANKEWINSSYSYNANFIKSLPIADTMTNKIIRSYFSLSPLYKNKKSKRVEIRFKRLSLNKILLGKSEIKHTNDKVIITLYVYNRNKKFLIQKLKNIYKGFYLFMSKVQAGLVSLKSRDAQKINTRNLFSGVRNKKIYGTLARTSQDKVMPLFSILKKPTFIIHKVRNLSSNFSLLSKYSKGKKLNLKRNTVQNLNTYDKKYKVYNNLTPQTLHSNNNLITLNLFATKKRLNDFIFKVKQRHLKKSFISLPLMKENYYLLGKYNGNSTKVVDNYN